MYVNIQVKLFNFVSFKLVELPEILFHISPNFMSVEVILLSQTVKNFRAYTALYIGGTPSQRTVTSPPAVYSSTTVYVLSIRKLDFSSIQMPIKKGSSVSVIELSTKSRVLNCIFTIAPKYYTQGQIQNAKFNHSEELY